MYENLSHFTPISNIANIDMKLIPLDVNDLSDVNVCVCAIRFYFAFVCFSDWLQSSHKEEIVKSERFYWDCVVFLTLQSNYLKSQ
jgi:hypothetical protein